MGLQCLDGLPVSTQPMRSEVPAAWAPSGCGNCYLALTKLDHHSAALTLTSPAPSTLRRTGDLKGSGECKAASAARSPKREQVAHCWYPGGPAQLPAAQPFSTRHTRHAGTKAMERDRIRRKMMKKKERKDLEGKEQPGERPEGPRGGGQGGPVWGERDAEKEQSEPQGSVETPNLATISPPLPAPTHSPSQHRDKPGQCSSTKPDH